MVLPSPTSLILKTNLNLSKGVLVRTLHEDGNRLGVSTLLNEGELVLTKYMLVYTSSITKTTLIYIKNCFKDKD
jgi:hypothetical protein